MRSLLRGLRRRERAEPPTMYDSWLEAFHGERLGPIEAACAEGGAERYALFRDLDVDLWALLLTQEYRAYPNIRALLPAMPHAELQQLWNGTSGVPLAAQGAGFYRKLRERYERHSDRPLADSRVLDFGCGWGRLTRFVARDVEPGNLCGCDPVEDILDVCRRTRVPGAFARSDFVPERVPFDGPFDLAFAFSVFTHLSEGAHESCLRALHTALRPGGILVVTIRPPAYLALSPPSGEARYVFRPHPAEATHFQYGGAGEMHYGETVITLPYIRERWSALFELLEVDLLVDDLYQVMVTLRRR
jgi:SAM-dependent methyltransferase